MTTPAGDPGRWRLTPLRGITGIVLVAVVASGVTVAAMGAIGSDRTVTTCFSRATGTWRPVDVGVRCKNGEAELALYTKGGADLTFLGAGAKAVDADKLDGIDSTGFLEATAKAADSDKLDGLDSTAYQYSAGTGLQLSGNTFSIDPEFRLPRSCTTGDVPVFDRESLPLTWHCSTPTGLPPALYKHQLPLVLFVEDISPTYTTVVSLNLPSGKWALSSTGRIEVFADGDETVGDCFLGKAQPTAPSDFDATVFDTVDGADVISNLSLTYLADLPSGGTVVLKCRAEGQLDSADALDFEILAIAVS